MLIYTEGRALRKEINLSAVASCCHSRAETGNGIANAIVHPSKRRFSLYLGAEFITHPMPVSPGYSLFQLNCSIMRFRVSYIKVPIRSGVRGVKLKRSD